MSIDNNFISEIIPPHEHRTLHILLSILAVSVVIGSIVFYQINQRNKEVVENKEIESPAISNVELQRIVETLNENKATSTETKPKELQKIVETLNKQSKDQPQISDEELRKIVETLNNR